MNYSYDQKNTKQKSSFCGSLNSVSSKHSSSVTSLLHDKSNRWFSGEYNDHSSAGYLKKDEKKEKPRIRAQILKMPKNDKRFDKSLGPGDLEQDQSISVSSYNSHANGVEIRASVEGGESSDTYPDGYRWTQTIDTNYPLGGTTSPYVDPRPNDDTKPFYYTDAEHARYSPNFYDRPSRPTPASGSTWWTATLSLNGVSGNTVTAFDTMSYGFSLDSAGNVTLNGASSVNKTSHQSILSSEFPGWTFS